MLQQSKKNRKRISQIEFTKEMLLHPAAKSCAYCKYNNYNYIEMTAEAIRFFNDKCTTCNLGAVTYVGEENIPYWFNNNFKLLYFWDKE